MKKLLGRVLLGAAGLIALLYTGDYLSVRLHIPARRTLFSVIHVQPYVAVPQKGGKVEYMLDTPYDQKCVNSLFPQIGLPACWYVRRNRNAGTSL